MAVISLLTKVTEEIIVFVFVLILYHNPTFNFINEQEQDMKPSIRD